MSCNAMFTGKFEFTCLLQLITRFRSIGEDGVSMALIQDTLWLAGNMISAFDPVGIVPAPSILSECSFEDLLDKVEAAFQDEEGQVTEVSLQALRDNPKAKDWTVFIPIILELIKMIIEKRNKPKDAPLGPAVTTQDIKGPVVAVKKVLPS